MEIHPHDLKWFKQQISRLPYNLRMKAQESYLRVAKEAYDSEPLLHKKDNAARRAANTRLRVYVEKVTSI